MTEHKTLLRGHVFPWHSIHTQNNENREKIDLLTFSIFLLLSAQLDHDSSNLNFKLRLDSLVAQYV